MIVSNRRMRVREICPALNQFNDLIRGPPGQ